MPLAVAWIAVPTIVGVMVGTRLQASPPFLVCALAAAWVAALACYRKGRPGTLTLAVALGAAAVGTALGSLEAADRLHPILRQQLQSGRVALRTPVLVEGSLRDDATTTSFGATFTLDLSRVTVDGSPVPTSGGVRVSVGGQLVADQLEEWSRGRSIRAPVSLRPPQPYRNPGVPDQDEALARREIAALATAKSGALVEVVARSTFIQERAARVRRWVRHCVRDAVGWWSPRSAAMTSAILIGDRAGLGDEVEERLRRAGTYHVVAISGGNIAILTALLLVMGRTCRLPPRMTAALTALGVGAYAVVVGSGASVVRASVVAVVYLVGLYLDLRASALALTLTAAVGILALRPLWWFDPGLWLTFGATVGILVGAGPMTAWTTEKIGRWWRDRSLRSTAAAALISLTAATIGAEAALLPIGAFLFSRMTVAGLVLNLAAVPLMSALQVSAIVVLAVSSVSPSAGRFLAAIPHACAAGIIDSAALVDLVPWTTRRVPAPSLIVLAAYYGGWLLFWLLSKRALARRVAFATTATAAMLVVWAPARPAWLTATPRNALVRGVADLEEHRGPLLSIAFLDVGQGDAEVVTFPDGARWLVDTGGLPNASAFDVGARIVAPALWALGVRGLDSLVLTHGHPDHAGGARAVVDDFRPARLWLGVPVAGDPLTEAVRAHARRAGVEVRHARTGQRGTTDDVAVRVLHPPSPGWERPRVRNDDSIGLELRKGTVSFVLTGDAGADVEPAIAGQVEPAGLRVLKVPHHGSRGASSAGFLRRLKPALAVVSAGAGNPFGHPSEQALARYRRLDIPVLRTDVDGAVWVGTDGRCVWVRTFGGREMSLGPTECQSGGAAGAGR